MNMEISGSTFHHSSPYEYKKCMYMEMNGNAGSHLMHVEMNDEI